MRLFPTSLMKLKIYFEKKNKIESEREREERGEKTTTTTTNQYGSFFLFFFFQLLMPVNFKV